MTYRERLREVRARAQRRTGNLYDTLFTRRVSAWITAAVAPLGVSPNAVSAANVVVGAAACALVAFGDSELAVVGALLIHPYAVLDSVDGELARYHRRSSLRGMFLENWSAYLMINGWLLAIGAWLTERAPYPAVVGASWPLWAAVVYAAFARNAMPVARRVVLEVMQKNAMMAREAAAAAGAARSGTLARQPNALRRFVEDSLLNQTNVWIVLSTLVVIGDARLVLGAFVFYLAGLVAKEVFVVAVMVGTPRLRAEIAAAYGEKSP